ncbi:MAG: 3-phosphoshikimate 1-carboxyvinyltransferase [Alphaproteobacteria bacterium]|nr:3-phosphoshikimate 1-carboxyvinyltransferase [Alphaproteobacteria bacterium]
MLGIQPARTGLSGSLRMPGDKSVSHRAFLINALARGEAKLSNVLDSEDVARSRELVRAIGVSVEKSGADWILRTPEVLREPLDVIDCGNSGTTIRLGCGVLAQVDGVSVLTGDASLRRRPMLRVVEPLRGVGAQIDGREHGRLPPLVVRGGAVHRTDVTLGIASAQVKSAVLLASRTCGVTVREPRRSRDHTERFLRAMGATLAEHDDGALSLEPGDWHAVDVRVPGDVSSAAFWMVAATLVPGSTLELHGVGLNPTRTGAIDALVAMGADIEVVPDEGDVEPQGTLVVRSAGLRGTRIGGELALRSLDELPVLAVAAAAAEGETVIADAAELRVKESDRIARVAAGLRAFGVEVEERPDGMVIAGGGLRAEEAPVIDAEGDHRLAMAFAVAGLASRAGVQLANADAVRTSYPTFFDDLDVVRT